jgi:hypothetical protein
MWPLSSLVQMLLQMTCLVHSFLGRHLCIVGYRQCFVTNDVTSTHSLAVTSCAIVVGGGPVQLCVLAWMISLLIKAHHEDHANAGSGLVRHMAAGSEGDLLCGDDARHASLCSAPT